jgi:hypothetical protein
MSTRKERFSSGELAIMFYGVVIALAGAFFFIKSLLK